MTEYLVDLLNVLMPFIPSIPIKLYPMWKSRDTKTRTVCLWTGFFLLLLSGGLFYVRRFYTLDLRVAQIYKALISIPNLFAGFWVFRKRAWKNIVLIAVSFMYNAISTGIGNYAGENWFQAARYPLLGASAVNLIVVALTLPPLLFMLRRLYENQTMKQASVFWRYIWLMPMGFFGLTLLTGSPFETGSFTGGYGFFIIRAIIYGALLLTCYLLDMAVRIVYEAETAKSESDEMARTNRFLDGLSSMKSEYLSNLSHEMKTPLTVLSLNLQRAARLFGAGGDMPDETRDKRIQAALASANEEAGRLVRMADAALRLASSQESRSRIRKLDLSALLINYADAYRPFLEKKGNSLTLDIPGTLPPVDGNPDLLAQVVINLLSNANAHTGGGEIAVSAETGAGAVVIAVRDNGEGVPGELLHRVFERGVSGRGGTGLGLTLCKTIAEFHGGTISLDSLPGKGTEVTVTLPVYQERLAIADE
ncbi:MAG: HAMP domain-containing histidine kinase [Oscillospiraceae bacterium]|nr:HAMP domain-containing histidine kinase [Oscillospiraceae bacterium]